ncbi:MAG: hypothetical protein ACFB4J_03530 [Elainellaceae cyanobacterium]
MSASLWVGLGLTTAGSIAVSWLSWQINLLMGVVFAATGCFFYLRANSLFLAYSLSVIEPRNNRHLQRFLLLDLLFMLSTCFVGSLLLLASLSRIFSEGLAVFGSTILSLT